MVFFTFFGKSQFTAPIKRAVLRLHQFVQYQCRGFFGARGNWLQLDEGAAAIWWAEEPPHDVHGPG